jgi:hypothetical protein
MAGIKPNQKSAASAGTKPEVTKVADLNAGPIHLRFADGELRYLYVGRKEIVRRVYLSVRDTRWDTPPTKVTNVNIQKTAKSFRINLDAVAQKGPIDYGWKEEIIGTPEGRITFKVEGRANADFKCNRFGICVHFGADSLAGQSYETVDADGTTVSGVFPQLLDPELMAKKFQTLKYTTSDGMQVITAVSPVAFGMEDQRNWADSSYKAFSSMSYPYPDIVKGAAGSETLTFEVRNAKQLTIPTGPIRVSFGAPIPGARMPKLLPPDAPRERGFFLHKNQNPAQYREAGLVAWPFCPAVNLFDDETFMENLSAIEDQARTARSFAPKAVLRISPLTIDPVYPRPSRDPRNQTIFGAAWSAAAIKHLAAGGVDEAAFDVGPGYARLVQERLATYAGAEVLASTFDGPLPQPVEALAVANQGATVIWLVNLKGVPQQHVVIRVPGSATRARLSRINEKTRLDQSLPVEEVSVRAGELRLDLAPYEVCEITEPAR